MELFEGKIGKESSTVYLSNLKIAIGIFNRYLFPRVKVEKMGIFREEK